jgi:hypothetical protein
VNPQFFIWRNNFFLFWLWNYEFGDVRAFPSFSLPSLKFNSLTPPGVTNHLRGWVEEEAIDPGSFREQYYTFQAYGFAHDPSLGVNPNAQAIVGNGQVAADLKGRLFLLDLHIANTFTSWLWGGGYPKQFCVHRLAVSLVTPIPQCNEMLWLAGWLAGC